MIQRLRRIGQGLLLGMAVGLTPAPASAQDLSPPPAEESSQGSPYYGYIGTGVILGMIIFVICKSARR